MSTQQIFPIGDGDYTREELHVIVARAHRERADALREMLASLFTRHKPTAEASKRTAHC